MYTEWQHKFDLWFRDKSEEAQMVIMGFILAGVLGLFAGFIWLVVQVS